LYFLVDCRPKIHQQVFSLTFSSWRYLRHVSINLLICHEVFIGQFLCTGWCSYPSLSAPSRVHRNLTWPLSSYVIMASKLDTMRWRNGKTYRADAEDNIEFYSWRVMMERSSSRLDKQILVKKSVISWS
jgi:hypothetical protein